MSDKITDYKRKFNDEKYDRIYITVKKGHKTEIEAHADKKGESLNGFVNRAIDDTIEKDGEQDGRNNH